MTEQERKEIMHLADMIEGEINRMCVTKDLEELDTMHSLVITNTDHLAVMIYHAKFAEDKADEKA